MRRVNFFGLALVLGLVGVKAWPTVQNQNNQGPQTASWPWMGGEAEKSFAYSPSFENSDGQNSKWNPQLYSVQQQKSNPFWPSSDPWSNFQPNNQYGSNGPSSPFDAGSQEPFPFESTEEFPYTRPYRTLYPQNQFPAPPPRPVMPDSMYMQEPPPMFPGSPPSGPAGPSPPPRGPMGQQPMGNGMMQGQMPMPMPPQHQHSFGHMNMMGQMGQNRPFDWTKSVIRSEMFPPATPLDYLLPRYPIEYSPAKYNNGSVPAITVQYNVTYTFSQMGWKSVDVSVSNATFHSAASQKAVEIVAPGGGLVPQNEAVKSPDMALTSGWWWWPKKTGSEVDGKVTTGTGKIMDGIMPGFGDGTSIPHVTPPQ